LPNAFNVKNSPQLTAGLKEMELQTNIRLASLDISRMYTNIPTMYLRDIIEDSLKLNSMEIQQTKRYIEFTIL
jgi:hypothetical protein